MKKTNENLTAKTCYNKRSEEINEVLSPLQYFYKYAPPQLFKDMAFYTNLYATQNEGKHKYKFRPTNEVELQHLVGIHFMIGTIDMKQLHRYWSPLINLKFSEKMSYKRFGHLRQNLHFVDKMCIPNENKDKFYAIRPLINSVRKRCLENPIEEILSVDEQIVPFTGHLNVKVYIRGIYDFYKTFTQVY